VRLSTTQLPAETTKSSPVLSVTFVSHLQLFIAESFGGWDGDGVAGNRQAAQGWRYAAVALPSANPSPFVPALCRGITNH
jgi:hypothetical protein